jgi:Ca-activated chloride channel family protein
VRLLSPEWLWLLVPVAGLLAAYVWLQLQRARYAVRFSNLRLLRSIAPRSPGRRRHVAAALILTSLASGVVAMARPATMVKIPRDTATVVVCIDVSLSMQSTDIKPTRLKAAQASAARFVNDMTPRFNVGLVSFAGSADLVVPPTTNHQEVVDGINQLQLAESTAIGEAIFTSLDAIKLMKQTNGGKAPPATIVLLSDGKTNSGRSTTTPRPPPSAPACRSTRSRSAPTAAR